MVVYSQRFPGLVKICDNCGCLFGYDMRDVWENKYVYCPICKNKIATNIHDAQPIEKEKKNENNPES